MLSYMIPTHSFLLVPWNWKSPRFENPPQLPISPRNEGVVIRGVIPPLFPKGWRWTCELPGVLCCLKKRWGSGKFHRSLGVVSYSCGARWRADCCVFFLGFWWKNASGWVELDWLRCGLVEGGGSWMWYILNFPRLEVRRLRKRWRPFHWHVASIIIIIIITIIIIIITNHPHP